MFGSLHLFARGAVAAARANTHSLTTTATSANITFCVSPTIAHVLCKRGLHTSAPRIAAFNNYNRGASSPETSSPSKESESTSSTAPVKSILPHDDPNWCHPYLGISTADYPRLIHLGISVKATEEDVKALLTKAGFPE